MARRRARALKWRTTAVAVAAIAATAATSAQAAPELTFQGEHGTLADKDVRAGSVKPQRAQKQRVRRLGAQVRWNRYGTPRSLTRTTGALATVSSARPEAAARQFVKRNAVLFRMARSEVKGLETLAVHSVGRGHTVLLRQRLGGLDVTDAGMIAVALDGRRVIYVTSSISGDGTAPPAAKLSATDAWLKAAADVGRDFTAAALSRVRAKDGWTTFRVEGLEGVQRSRLVAFPTYTQGNRPAFETIFFDREGGDHGVEAYTHFVDAITGKVWARRSRVDYLANNPRWKVFPANPSLALTGAPTGDPEPTEEAFYRYSDGDTRQVWCWEPLAATDPQDPRCQRTLSDEQPRTPTYGEWDRQIVPTPLVTLFPPTNSSRGNNADSAEARLSPFTGGIPGEYDYFQPSRDYIFPWQNEWNASACDPSTIVVPGQGADADAAIANLFAMHNRMHDWSYHLGFQEQTWNLQQTNFGRSVPGGASRENDPEHGGVQAGAITGGQPTFLGRDNANQITFNDGIPGLTNMYLWQPLQAGFYAPCVDGDYDMSVIGHEYTHAISNRMAAGPDAGLSSRQARSMGESWSDLAAVEYLNEYRFVPTNDENPFAVGAYVTGDKQAGIRNYGMNESPLNYSDIGYDVTGPQVHADGEIWSATNFEIRQAFIEKYGEGTAAQQEACASTSGVNVTEGGTPGNVSLSSCPGNRRWAGIMFAAFLTMQPDVDMIDARDAYLAADRQLFGTREFGGGEASYNADLLWTVFARRGLGHLPDPNTGERAENADSRDGDSEEIIDANESDPEPSFGMPHVPFGSQNATVRFRPVAGGRARRGVRIFVGDYEARATPVADTIRGEDDPGRDRPRTRKFAPGTYRFVAVKEGFGHVRFTETFAPGQQATVTIPMSRNLASASNGAAASGTGGEHRNLIDDTEDTQWSGTGAPEEQRVTVALDRRAGGAEPGTRVLDVGRVRVSALLRPTLPLEGDPFDQDPSQSRFAALRSFEIWTCTKNAAVDCTTDEHFAKRFASPEDAFPARRPRPRAPELILRSFDIPDTTATHVQLRVVDNQCTGTPGYHGEQDADPFNPTDCRGAAAATRTFAAELQVLGPDAPF